LLTRALMGDPIHIPTLPFQGDLSVLLYFENSDGCSKGSQELDKQLTSPEVMARSNSSD